ncbi:hypothetical protein [Halobacillus sp. Marseille-Q1614]|uniref:hypothetical protein n=1 Tax=Halobacillus sp. Marseille-Q1614 TaxID=2709134 RepID=UPI00156E62F1|nr:hypothetical protein [Halobacillus sp. Marseille-Q1614]
MKSEFYIRPVIERKEAVKRINEHTSNKILKLFKGRQKLVSIEQIYLPYWCYDYTLKTPSLKDGIQGKVALETITKTPAILPSDYPLLPMDADVKTLPIIGDEDQEAAKKAIYWEAFRKEKRKKSIDLTLHSPWILYMPYWIGYLEAKGYEILPVDAVSGNLDLTIKESFLKIFSEAG